MIFRSEWLKFRVVGTAKRFDPAEWPADSVAPESISGATGGYASAPVASGERVPSPITIASTGERA